MNSIFHVKLDLELFVCITNTNVMGDLYVLIDQMKMNVVNIEFFHRVSKGELAERGGGKTSELLCNELFAYTFKGCRMGRSDKVSLWYVALLINTRFRFLF